MKRQKAPLKRAALAYADGDKERFESRLHKNAKSREPRVPVMTATKGKRTKFTGMTTKGAVLSLKKSRAEKTAKNAK